MVTVAKKIIIFLGVPNDFRRMPFKQFWDVIWQKGIQSVIYDINDIDVLIGSGEILKTYSSDEAVICCFKGPRCDNAEKILKNLSLNVVVADSLDMTDYAADILGKFKS
ncbi:MAG: hypothetical protein AAB757_02160 [Patescibacteria group bacterium]